MNIREELKRIIKESPEAIKEEFNRTANDWLTCFGTKIATIETYLDLKEVNETISPEEVEKLRTRLEELKQAKSGFTQKNKEPSEEEKQRLLSQLNFFKKD